MLDLKTRYQTVIFAHDPLFLNIRNYCIIDNWNPKRFP